MNPAQNLAEADRVRSGMELFPFRWCAPLAAVAATALLLATSCSLNDTPPAPSSTIAVATEAEAPASSSAGATETGSPDETEAPQAPVDLGEEPLIPSPLQAYRLTTTEYVTISYAVDLLVTECMARFGFDYPPPYPFNVALQRMFEADRWSNARRYGITDRDWAAKYGYGLAPDDWVDPIGRELSAAENFVLSGERVDADGAILIRSPGIQTESPGEVDGVEIPAGGCSGAAHREMGTNDPDIPAYGLANNVLIETSFVSQTSDEYRQVVDEWVACMAEDGYRVTNFLDDKGDIKAKTDARLAVGDESADGPPVAGEVELALADIDCKERINLVERLEKITAAFDQQAIEDNQLALEEDRARLDAQVRKATDIIAKDNG